MRGLITIKGGHGMVGGLCSNLHRQSLLFAQKRNRIVFDEPSAPTSTGLPHESEEAINQTP